MRSAGRNTKPAFSVALTSPLSEVCEQRASLSDIVPFLFPFPSTQLVLLMQMVSSGSQLLTCSLGAGRSRPPLARMGHRSGCRGLAAARVVPCQFPFKQPAGLHEMIELCLEQGECSSRGSKSWDSQTKLVLPLASIKGAISWSGERPSLCLSAPGMINLPWRYGAAQVTKRNGLCNCREQGQKKISIADTKMILKMLKLSK